jgi:hypothetical protein
VTIPRYIPPALRGRLSRHRTSKRVFQGDRITETVASILKSEPDWTLLSTDTPLFVRAVLRQCLRKDPNLRLHDVADARVLTRERISEPSAVAPVTHRFSIGWALSIGAAIVVGLLIGGMVAMKYFRPTPAPLVVRSIIRLDPGQWLAGMGRPRTSWRPSRTAMAISRDARYVPTGHIVFLRRGILMAVPFDIDSLEMTGQPVAVIANITQALKIKLASACTGAGKFSISDSGWLVYAPGGISPYSQDSIVWVDRKGAEHPFTKCVDCYAPRVSPDGSRIVYGSSEDRLWVYDTDRGTASPLTSEGWSADAIWTPDGKRVTLTWMKSWMPNVYWQMADGSSPMERLTTSDWYQELGSWSHDGATLAFVESRKGNMDILLLDLPSRQVKPFLNSPSLERDPAFSPDGHWLAYLSNESGRMEVDVRPFRRNECKWQISSQGGERPVWARGGNELFYSWRDQMWIVDVQIGTRFVPGKPRLLFERPGYVFNDVSPDAQRLLVTKLDDRKPQPITEMILVQNWYEELKRLCPTGKK